jgi:hypothetical protein
VASKGCSFEEEDSSYRQEWIHVWNFIPRHPIPFEQTLAATMDYPNLAE